MYHHQMYNLIIEFSEWGLIEWHMLLGTCHSDLCTNRFHFYSNVVIRDLSGNVTLLGGNYIV